MRLLMQLTEYFFFTVSITSQIIRQRERYHTVFFFLFALLFYCFHRFVCSSSFIHNVTVSNRIQICKICSFFGIARTFVQFRNKIFVRSRTLSLFRSFSISLSRFGRSSVLIIKLSICNWIFQLKIY